MSNICSKCPAKINLMRIDGNTKRALAIRLEEVLKEEERQLAFYREHVKPRATKTTSSQVERVYRQKIQALKIVIYILKPLRGGGDFTFPGFWRKSAE